MNKIKYTLIKTLGKILRLDNAFLVDQFRKEGINIGEKTHIFSNIITSEPYLINIGNNCTISTEVIFITHDASIGIYQDRHIFSDICGIISIGNNCFIGNRSILLYGVELADNTIVAAGSVVCNSLKTPGCIIGGNPAKVIGKVDDFLAKNTPNYLSLHGLSHTERKNKILSSGKLITR